MNHETAPARRDFFVVCADAEDAALAVRLAADHGVALTVKGGGHNIAGRSVADGAVLLDLSRMRGVTVNPESLLATVQGVALWHDVDVASAAQINMDVTTMIAARFHSVVVLGRSPP